MGHYRESAMMEDGFPIRPGLTIPPREAWFEFSHASGPGGQNVNKVATAATLCFHPASTTHRQMTDSEMAAAGIRPEFVRLSVGLESVGDILEDVTQALEFA